ncbi:MAG: pyridoxal-phosphate dependent enzyme [Verrucomicrobia bacterium]|nr:pyridoxal-phosphate dependent enzyme [Verrucomicrobiota bacterium]
MPPANLHLLRRFPRLRDTMCFVPLGTYPVPVERLAGIERALRMWEGPQRRDHRGRQPRRGAEAPPTFGATELWAKRDDFSGEPWGMSKVRKLEHYFGDARASAAQRVLTFGPLGSNHALATALYGKQLGFEVHLQLWPEPPSERVRQTLLAEHALGAKLFLTGTLDERALVELADANVAQASSLRSESNPQAGSLRHTYIIPPAGTDPIGAMGYVEAGLELGEQAARGELPAPDFVHVAGGTGGVAAGLLIGLRLAGLSARIVAIRCVAPEVLTEMRLVFLARRIHQRLAQLAGVDAASLPQPQPDDFLILHAHAGAGYGQPTPDSERARELFAAESGLVLDPIYTAKAGAGVLSFAASEAGAGKRHLFWHTYAHCDLGGLAAGARWQNLPAMFHPFFNLSQ